MASLLDEVRMAEDEREEEEAEANEAAAAGGGNDGCVWLVVGSVSFESSVCWCVPTCFPLTDYPPTHAHMCRAMDVEGGGENGTGDEEDSAAGGSKRALEGAGGGEAKKARVD